MVLCREWGGASHGEGLPAWREEQVVFGGLGGCALGSMGEGLEDQSCLGGNTPPFSSGSKVGKVSLPKPSQNPVFLLFSAVFPCIVHFTERVIHISGPGFYSICSPVCEEEFRPPLFMQVEA